MDTHPRNAHRLELLLFTTTTNFMVKKKKDLGILKINQCYFLILIRLLSDLLVDKILSISYTAFFLRQMKKEFSNHDTFMKSILHYFFHLCIYLLHLFIHSH